jgi:hypothetical protein
MGKEYCYKRSRPKLRYIPIVNQKDDLLFQIIILVKRSTCFGGLFVHHQALKTAYTTTVYAKQLLLLATIGDEMFYLIPDSSR